MCSAMCSADMQDAAFSRHRSVRKLAIINRLQDVGIPAVVPV
jgi:hypothetical protein